MRLRPLCIILVCASVLATPSLAAAQMADTPSANIETEAKSSATDPVIIKAYPPYMPSRANKSGYCCMVMTVNEAGRPKDVRTSLCSEPKFKKAAIRATKKMRFDPGTVNGTPVSTPDMTTTMSFLYLNPRGELVPDPDGRLVQGNKVVRTSAALCTELGQS